MGPSFRLVVVASVFMLAAGSAHCQTGGPTPSPPGASVYFVDLKDGTAIGSHAVVHFGLRGMGVAPAGSDKENSGHHHILIDVPLPPMDQPIPNDFNHLHFGAGQSETELQLTPGEHTLQLVLGDRNHIPHSPPVVSERIKVRVVESAAAPASVAGFAQRRPSPAGAKVYFAQPANHAYVPPKLLVRFGLVNMGVAPAGVEKANTGHHHVIVDRPLPPVDQPIPNDFNHLHFGAGQTEATINLPLGTHTLQLLLGDENHVPHDPPIFSKPIKVTVTATGRRPNAKRSKRTARSNR